MSYEQLKLTLIFAYATACFVAYGVVYLMTEEDSNEQ